MKKFLKSKFVRRLAAPILRGVIKGTVPGGTAIVESLRNAGHEAGVTKASNEAPHTWLSIAIQVICVAAVVYAFVTKAITVDQVLKLLGFGG